MYKIILTVALIFFISGCSSEKKERLKVAISPWPGYEPLVLGMERGFYSDLDIRIVRFATPTDSFRALRDGIVDVAAFTADEVLHYSELKNKPKIFLVLDISNGGDAIIARENIKSLDDLKDKTVCIEPSALGNYIIHRAMDFTDGLSVYDFEIIAADIGNHVELYQNGKIDAIVTYEPFTSQLIKEGAHVIFDSKKIPNEIIDVLVCDDETLKNSPKALKKLTDGWFKTVEYIKENKKEAMKQMAAYEYISTEAFEQAYNELIIPSREENLKMLGASEKSYSSSLERLSKVMLEKGSLSKGLNTSELMSDSILKRRD